MRTPIKRTLRRYPLTTLVLASLIAVLGQPSVAEALTHRYANDVATPNYTYRTSPYGTHTGGRASLSATAYTKIIQTATGPSGSVLQYAIGGPGGAITLQHGPLASTVSRCLWHHTSVISGNAGLTCDRYY
jgi:hypothetical protein